MFSAHRGTLDTQFCSAPSSSWTRLKGYCFRPNYYLTSLSPADPAPPLFLWATSLPKAHPSAPPHPPISQPHTSHFPSPPLTNPEPGAWGHQPETCRPWPHTQQGCCEVISPGLAYHRAGALLDKEEKGGLAEETCAELQPSNRWQQHKALKTCWWFLWGNSRVGDQTAGHHLAPWLT